MRIPYSRRWNSFIYHVVKGFLDRCDAHSLWISSPHLAHYPDFKPRVTNGNRYAMWSLRQIPIELSVRGREMVCVYHQEVLREVLGVTPLVKSPPTGMTYMMYRPDYDGDIHCLYDQEVYREILGLYDVYREILGVTPPLLEGHT